MARFLHGLHDAGGESLHGGRPGWTLISEEVGLNEQAQGKDYTDISNQGIGVIIRLNYSHMGQGTFPLPQDYTRFAKACASFVRSSKGVSHWIIGNEPNHEGERPQGQVISPQDAGKAFVEVRNAIKTSVGQHILVGPPAIAPYHAQPIPWDEYLTLMMVYIMQHGGCDFLNYHAYARSMAPDMLVNEKEMDSPLEGLSYGFGALWDGFTATPDSLWHLPAMLTEFDITKEWEDRDTGIIEAMYYQLHVSNTDGYWPKIIAGICFRWLMGQNSPVDWGMSAKGNLLNDFKKAVAKGYQAPTVGGKNTFLPSVPGGATPPPKPTEPSPQPTPKADIDKRFLDRGSKLHPGSGDKVWRLRKATKVPSSESGGRRNIYVEAYDEAGNPVSDVPFQVKWSGGPDNIIYKTNGKKGFDAGNFPMTPGAFDVWIKDGLHDSDAISGIEMGEETPGGWNAGHHTAAILEFYLEKAQEDQPEEPETPSQPPPGTTPQPPPSGGATVPYLAHPIAEPAYRTVSQGWGARPEVYSKYKIDGVPLLGHEGIDFAAPLGAKVQAVDDGYVAEVGNQGDKGYGKYIKLIHSWGETVYAHLDSQWIAQGETVKKGQGLGQVGYTGNVEPKGPSGAHLHFGLRTNPHNRQDGWGGYKNPASYLAGSQGSPGGPQPQPQDKAGLLKTVRDAAKEFGVSENLLISLIHGESSFDPLAENKSSGAKGLGQLRDGAWRDATSKTGGTDIFNPRDNARATAYYLKWCMGLVGGDERRGLWAYNWSPRDTPKGLVPPGETIEFASKILHGKEVLDLAGV